MNEADFSGAAATAQATPILIAPQAVLRQKGRVVRPEDMAALREGLPGMFAAMYQAPGIGLAAPQIGISMRYAIVDLGEEDAREPIVLINPEIISESEVLHSREEGCLSLPNQYAEVVRPEAVRVRYTSLAGEQIERDVDGLLATCIQHEIDHLDGVLFVDHLSALRRNMILRRLAKEQKAKRG
ncbi:N-formylmethionylaminoacyl-tRNA deformylase [Acetobacter nitrogenifigens DSM 23921 = NBRC 105050]|uniref:Peptide deformylase n=1 Tax=Acetobacter nitrogenifigens DSM 23921 = NBRC 105050 TaxID=1120919 RepID=A0A511XCY9_9PROT|nr:peptide deformylase [Acetobacter nitrogenifigens]GBQ91566.1 N-formylmethionylaminoacyl-tRNA deformylase [Acetobacter nitrogenifigens DSM 23921 = NBRC 105050]GEN60829.1 peptide deformylase [Acetobacter nitrogenifigens DSM 23921 = NBRC 105050]